jgi:hypothetical protein
MTTRARATKAPVEAPVKAYVEAPTKAAPETAPEPINQQVTNYDNVINLFSDTNSNVSDPPSMIPENDMHGDTHREATPGTTPELEDKAPEPPLEDLIRDAYTNNELVQAIIKAVNERIYIPESQRLWYRIIETYH